jgi:hypothetical protein
MLYAAEQLRPSRRIIPAETDQETQGHKDETERKNPTEQVEEEGYPITGVLPLRKSDDSGKKKSSQRAGMACFFPCTNLAFVLYSGPWNVEMAPTTLIPSQLS